MRRLLASASLFAATALAAPMAALPTEVAAQQAGLVNVDVGGVRILNNANVGVAVAALVQACDLIDATNTSVIVGLVSAVASGQDADGTATTTCNADGDAIITQATGPRERGGSNR